MTTIVISNGHILVDDKLYVSLDFEAYSENGAIGIRHINQKDLTLIKGRVLPSEIKLNGTLYVTAEEFVLNFNLLAMGTLMGGQSEIKTNTDYPTEIISTVLTPNDPTGITAQTKPGYVTLYAPNANTGVIYVGTDAVDDSCAAIEAGKSYPAELGDLARIFVKNSVAGEKVHVFGAYKD
jgi:hypothetical protein